jgi:hypothetical protein
MRPTSITVQPRSRPGRARYGGLTWLMANFRRCAAGTGHRGGYPGSGGLEISRTRPAGRGRRAADGRSRRPVRCVDRGPTDRRRDAVREGPKWTAVRSPRLRGELRLPRVGVTCAIGPADVHLRETLDGPHEGPLAPMAPPHAAVIGGTVRVEPVGRGDPPQDDLIDRARGIVQRAPTVHSLENGRAAGNLRKRGRPGETPIVRWRWDTQPQPDGPGVVVVIIQ